MSPVPCFLSLVIFSLLGSGFSRLTRLDPGPIAPAASLLTLGVGVWATYAEYVRMVPGAWGRMGLALVIGAAAEVMGLATGFPFGRYAYTGAWWPSVGLPVGPFPLALPFAWLLMAGASRLSLAGRRLQSASVSQALAWSAFGGLIAALIDLVMEPVMAGPLGYWRWLSPGPLPGGAPWSNFFGWWGTATVAGWVLTFRASAVGVSAARWVLGGFVALILGLGLIRGL